MIIVFSKNMEYFVKSILYNKYYWNTYSYLLDFIDFIDNIII